MAKLNVNTTYEIYEREIKYKQMYCCKSITPK